MHDVLNTKTFLQKQQAARRRDVTNLERGRVFRDGRSSVFQLKHIVDQSFSKLISYLSLRFFREMEIGNYTRAESASFLVKTFVDQQLKNDDSASRSTNDTWSYTP